MQAPHDHHHEQAGWNANGYIDRQNNWSLDLHLCEIEPGVPALHYFFLFGQEFPATVEVFGIKIEGGGIRKNPEKFQGIDGKFALPKAPETPVTPDSDLWKQTLVKHNEALAIIWAEVEKIRAAVAEANKTRQAAAGVVAKAVDRGFLSNN